LFWVGFFVVLVRFCWCFSWLGATKRSDRMCCCGADFSLVRRGKVGVLLDVVPSMTIGGEPAQPSMPLPRECVHFPSKRSWAGLSAWHEWRIHAVLPGSAQRVCGCLDGMWTRPPHITPCPDRCLTLRRRMTPTRQAIVRQMPGRLLRRPYATDRTGRKENHRTKTAEPDRKRPPATQNVL
jgi:hypothetical protein